MIFRLIYLSFFGCLFSFITLAAQSPATQETTKASLEILKAQYALYQNDTKPAEQLISQQSKLTKLEDISLALQQLQVLVWVQQEETDKATDLLLRLQEHHNQNADIHFFSGGAWKKLAHKVSIFSKIKYYRRAVTAYIRAGELAPKNAKYVRKQASSYAQPEMFGGIEGKQKPMLKKIIALDVKYGLVAKMDLAQNEQQHNKARQLAEQAISEYSDSFLLVERAAQMHWTLENEERAQELFVQACNFPAQIATARMTWISSCYGVVYLTLKTDKNHGLAVSAMQRLLSINKLKTSDNDQARLYLAEMATRAGNKSLALATYRKLIEQALDKNIKKKAKKAFKKLS